MLKTQIPLGYETSAARTHFHQPLRLLAGFLFPAQIEHHIFSSHVATGLINFYQLQDASMNPSPPISL